MDPNFIKQCIEGTEGAHTMRRSNLTGARRVLVDKTGKPVAGQIAQNPHVMHAQSTSADNADTRRALTRERWHQCARRQNPTPR